MSLCLQYHQRVNGMYVMWTQPGYSQHLADTFFLTLIGHFSSSHLVSPLLWIQIGSASASRHLEHISGLLMVTISSSKKGCFALHFRAETENTSNLSTSPHYVTITELNLRWVVLGYFLPSLDLD